MSDSNNIDKICKDFNIKNYTITPWNAIDVNGDINLNGERLSELPLQFNVIYGNFYCSGNQLTTLKGCPIKVTGNFYCYDNNLTDLEYCPKKVGGNFDCSNNELTSLKGCPDKVKGFHCGWNNLKNLNGCPSVVTNDFYCSMNSLTTLEYTPDSIGFDFKAESNMLTTLENIPNCLDAYLNNNEITSLKSNKSKIKGCLHLLDNEINDIDGFQLDIGGVIFTNKGDLNFLINGKELDWINALIKWKIINVENKEINKKKLDYLISIYNTESPTDIDYTDPDNFDKLPSNISKIVDNFLSGEVSYGEMGELSNILSANGWYMDYGLDGSIIQLQPNNSNGIYDRLKENGFKFI